MGLIAKNDIENPFLRLVVIESVRVDEKAWCSSCLGHERSQICRECLGARRMHGRPRAVFEDFQKKVGGYDALSCARATRDDEYAAVSCSRELLDHPPNDVVGGPLLIEQPPCGCPGKCPREPGNQRLGWAVPSSHEFRQQFKPASSPGGGGPDVGRRGLAARRTVDR